ncbi:MAG: Hpt domain-containing protein [Pseudobdellovibrionaceae bacterium]
MSTTAKQKLSEVLQELRREYLLKFPQKIEKLRKLTEAQDWKALEEEYHKLKGTGKTYGFPGVSQICERLEVMAQKPQTQIADVFEKSLELLERMHQKHIENQSLDLSADTFARSLLALKVK